MVASVLPAMMIVALATAIFGPGLRARDCLLRDVASILVARCLRDLDDVRL